MLKLRMLLQAAIDDLKNMDAGGDVCYGCRHDGLSCPYEYECVRQKGTDYDYWEWRGMQNDHLV